MAARSLVERKQRSQARMHSRHSNEHGQERAAASHSPDQAPSIRFLHRRMSLTTVDTLSCLSQSQPRTVLSSISLSAP